MYTYLFQICSDVLIVVPGLVELEEVLRSQRLRRVGLLRRPLDHLVKKGGKTDTAKKREKVYLVVFYNDRNIHTVSDYICNCIIFTYFFI